MEDWKMSIIRKIYGQIKKKEKKISIESDRDGIFKVQNNRKKKKKLNLKELMRSCGRWQSVDRQVNLERLINKQKY